MIATLGIGLGLLAACIVSVVLFLVFCNWLFEDEDGRFKHRLTLGLLGGAFALVLAWALGTAFLETVVK